MEDRKVEEIIENLERKAKENVKHCGNCAQSAFLALQEEFELGGDGVLKALTPFPGIALRGETCGAVTGSLMALGLVFGRGKEDLGNFRKYQRSLPSARKFCFMFEEELGSMLCSKIVEDKFGRSFDLANRADALRWAASGAKEKCGEVVAVGVRIAGEIIITKGRKK